jgi:dipeptidyl aminopeptidase/acylaminoacyl peptidase
MAALASASLAPPSAAEPPPPLPIQALAEQPFISEPVLSPDGKRIVAKINVAGRERLAVFDLADGADAKPQRVPHEGILRWFGWAGNDRILIGRGSFGLLFGLLPLPVTRLSRYDLKSGTSLELGKGEGLLGDDVIFKDPEGAYVLLSAQKDFDDSPSVSRVDLATGAQVEVQKKKADIWEWFADSSGTIRGGISYSGKRWTIYSRDPRSGELRKAASGRASEKESVVEKIGLLPGTEAGFIVTNEPTGRFGIYNYDLRAQTIGTPIFEHPEVDITEPRLSADGMMVEGAVYEDDRPRVEWLTPARRKLQATIDKALPGKVNRIIGESRDGNVVLIWAGAADDPGAFYVLDRKAKRMNAFAAPYNGLVDHRLSPVKPIRYAARDGLSIPGYLSLPAGRDPKGLPLIVMPHGGPFARDSYRFDPWVQLLASRGYAVLQPNFRGSTGYGRDYVERGYGQWGKAMQDDLDDGVAWLAKQGTIDPARVCIMGGSYGGYAALWGAIRNPETYRCAISFAGVTDIRGMLKYDAKFLMAPRYWKQWRNRIQGDDKRDLGAVSPLQQAARLSRPVLIAHGEKDSTVPVDQGRRLVAALRQRGASVLSAFYPGADHSLSSSADSADFMKRVEAFLQIHNPAGPAAKGPRDPELVAGAILPGEIQPGKKAKRKAVDIRYLVTSDGRVTSCTIAGTSGAAAADKDACRIAEERFQYRPALAADGARQESWLTYSATLETPAKK